MILQEITELLLVNIVDRGNPNQERMVFRATEAVNLGLYGIWLGVKRSPGFATPILDNFFWFGVATLSAGDWIFVYTCSGRARTTDIPNSANKIYTVFWGRKRVVLNDPQIVPILVRIDAVKVFQEGYLPLLGNQTY